jgi:hypothetical protein
MMTRLAILVALVMSHHAFVVLAKEPASQVSLAREQYRRLLDEFQKSRRPRQFAAKFLELGKNQADEQVAVDSLHWVVSNLRFRPEAQEAIRLLESHWNSQAVAGTLEAVAKCATPEAEQLLRVTLEKSPHESVRAQACFQWTELLRERLELHAQFQKQPDAAKRMEQYYGRELTGLVVALDARSVNEQREELFERIRTSFADEVTPNGPLGEIAERALFALRHLSVGRTAPEIEGPDIEGQRFKLSDYRGKVVLLSFWGHW